MNFIKKISRHTCVISLAVGIMSIISVNSIAGTVFTSSTGEKIITELDNVNVSLNSRIGWIFGGYKISDNGENLPYLSIVPTDGSATKSWPLGEGNPLQFFHKKDNDYLLLSTGKVVKVVYSGVSNSELEFKPDSLVISSEPTLIACTSIGFVRKLTASKMSSCYRVDKTWDVELYWTRMDIPPMICEGNLKVLVSTDKRRKWEVVVLDQDTGKQISSKVVGKPQGGESICNL